MLQTLKKPILLQIVQIFFSKNLEVSPKNLHHSDNVDNTGCLKPQ